MQTLNISLPKDLVEKVDQVAKKEYRNRSELIREALRVYLENSYKWENLLSYSRLRGKAAGIKNEQDVDQLVSDFRHGR